MTRHADSACDMHLRLDRPDHQHERLAPHRPAGLSLLPQRCAGGGGAAGNGDAGGRMPERGVVGDGGEYARQGVRGKWGVSIAVMFLLVWSQLACAAITRIGSGTNHCASASTCAVTYSPTAGNFVAVASQSTSDVATSTTDNGSSTYSSAFIIGGSSQWYVCAVNSGVTSISINYGSSQGGITVIVVEYSGIAASGCLDQAVVALATSAGTSAQSNDITTTKPTEIALGWFTTFGGGSTVFTASGTGWGNTTSVVQGSNVLAVTDKSLSSTSTEHATASINASVTWFAGVSSFSVASGVKHRSIQFRHFNLGSWLTAQVQRWLLPHLAYTGGHR